MEAVGTGGAFEGDAALFVDDVEPVRPGGIGLFRCVFDVVEECGDFDFQTADAGVGHGLTLRVRLRVGVNDALFLVDGELPAIARMRLLDVDDEELRAVFVLLVETVEGRNLPPEWRSSVTAEDEDDGAAGELAQGDSSGLIVPGEVEAGRGIAG